MPSSSMVTFRYRIKDATARQHLLRMAWAVNTVWNYCNEVSLLVLRRDKRWLSAFELINLVAGTSKTLGLHADTLSEICREYVAKRRASGKARLKWRSRKRSLGWLPFKARFLRLEGDTITYLGHRFRFWHSRPLEGMVKTGNFAQDARGHWYVNLQCAVQNASEPPGRVEIGIDLGCVNQLVCSDRPEPYSRENLTRKYAAQLAMAQRARKARRVKAMHAKIASCRKDWAHKTTTEIVRRAKLIVVGNVSSTQLAATRLAKSVYNAGWGQLRTLLHYKAIRLGATYCEVNESGSSVTCSVCLARSGPSGLRTLGVRVWTCTYCGFVHNRDLNAAHNILRLGRQALFRNPST
ncbi:MAG TPA: transposase [Candidatus Tectomicrobia bacterium]